MLDTADPGNGTAQKHTGSFVLSLASLALYGQQKSNSPQGGPLSAPCPELQCTASLVSRSLRGVRLRRVIGKAGEMIFRERKWKGENT